MNYQNVPPQQRLNLPPTQTRIPEWVRACGCLLALMVGGGILLLAAVLFILERGGLVGAAAQIAGLQAQGDVGAVFATQAVVQPQPLVPVLTNVTQPAQVVINVPGRGAETISTQGNARAQVGQQAGGNAAGLEAAVLTFDETALLQLCAERTPVCRNEDPRIQNVRVDLRPGGAILYGDVRLPELEAVGLSGQTIGAVLQVEGATGLRFTGLDLGGLFYAGVPANVGDLAARLTEAQANLQRALNEFTVQTERDTLRLSQIAADDNQLTLVFQ